jgi:ketosteroid isomerase-like protein
MSGQNRHDQAMSEDNVQLVRRCYEFWRHRDYSILPELFDPDVMLDLSRNVFNPDVYRGHDGLSRRRVLQMVGGYRERGEALDAARQSTKGGVP